MKRVLILGAVLFFAITFSSFRVNNEPVKNENQRFVFLLGSQTHNSAVGNYTVTVWVAYNPANSTIVDVYAEDAVGNPITVTGYGTGISSSGQTIIASNFQVNISYFGADYVILDGALDMV